MKKRIRKICNSCIHFNVESTLSYTRKHLTSVSCKENLEFCVPVGDKGNLLCSSYRVDFTETEACSFLENVLKENGMK